jgi:hypothetical protein
MKGHKTQEEIKALADALRKTASFLRECHQLYYRKGSGWLGWNEWARQLLNWADRLVGAYDNKNDDEVRSVLTSIRQDAIERHMGNLADNLIIDEQKRILARDLNLPLTEVEKEANRHKDRLLGEIRRSYMPLARRYDSDFS